MVAQGPARAGSMPRTGAFSLNPVSILKCIAASALLAIALAPAARAGSELYLRWDQCRGDGGTYNKVFACDENLATNDLVGSFRPDRSLEQMSGFSAVLDFTSTSAGLPLWWEMWGGACRQGSMSVSLVPPLNSTACLEPWDPSQLAGGTAIVQWQSGMRLRIGFALPAPQGVPVQAGQEYFAFQVRINHAGTTGSPVCTDCGVPICIGWVEALFTVVPGTGDNLVLHGADTPNNGPNVTWQTGAVATSWRNCLTYYCEYGVMCQSVTPTQRSTWASIKTLYR